MKSVLVVEPGWYILRYGLLDQLRFLSSCGYRIGIASEDDCRARAVAREIDATFYPLDLCRYPSLRADFSAMRRLSAVFREFRPSIVQSSTKKAGLLVGVLGWRYGVSVVYIVRGLNSERVTARTMRAFRIVERLNTALADRVVMISNSNIQYFLDNHICDRKKIIMFGSGSFTGVDSQRFKRTLETETAGKELRRKLDIPGNAYVIGFVGRVVVEKGIRELVLAWQQLKSDNPQLHMIIVAPPEIGPGAETAVNCLRSDNNVHFTGFMPDPVPAYAAMNCLVLPSYSEGFGCVLLEAACFELSAVATNVPGCIDAVVEGHTGWLVEARDEKALVDAIRRTYREPDVARQLGENARTRAVAEFSQELIWFGYAELYDVLSRPPKSKWRSILRSSSVVPEHLS